MLLQNVTVTKQFCVHLCMCVHLCPWTYVCEFGEACGCKYMYIHLNKKQVYAYVVHTTCVAYLWHIYSFACTAAHVSHRQHLRRN